MSHGSHRPGEVTFTGRNPTDAKRKALNYWFVNKAKLGLSIKEFSERLLMLPDGKTIVFQPQRARLGPHTP